LDQSRHGTSLAVDTTCGHAVRKPASKQEATARGGTFFNGVEVYHESELEHRVSLTIQGRNDVRELHSQYPVFLYVGADGKIHKHINDFLAIFADGHRLAIPVKYDKKAESMKDLISRCRKAGFTAIDKNNELTLGVVDDMIHISETDVTLEDFENAQDLIHYRGHHDDVECRVLLDIVRQLPGAFHMGELFRGYAKGGKRRTAIWRLIDLGYLVPVSRGRIDELAWLRFSD
jgi:hypothetical protein